MAVANVNEIQAVAASTLSSLSSLKTSLESSIVDAQNNQASTLQAALQSAHDAVAAQIAALTPIVNALTDAYKAANM